MLNYIALGVSAVILLLSLIAVLTEFISYNTKVGRILRKLRITLREISFSALVVTAVVLLILSVVTGDHNRKMMWADVGILAASWLILHIRRFIGVNRSRHHAHKKKTLPTVGRSSISDKLAPLAAEAALAKELPEAAAAAEGKGKDIA